MEEEKSVESIYYIWRRKVHKKSDDNSLNEAELVENVEDQEDLNSKTLEETEHKSESEGKGRVKLMSKKILVVGLALFFLWWCLLGQCNLSSLLL
ncbi:hypothetical protein ACOSP7_021415 [Xanthoceras sorbifolium]